MSKKQVSKKNDNQPAALPPVKVVATSLGFYGNKRIREGQSFYMPASKIQRDPSGAIVAPRWVREFAAKQKEVDVSFDEIEDENAGILESEEAIIDPDEEII